ncbi:carbamoyltransferase HypF [Butyrivibrio sp. WCD3002]|uniref:carbamoyltransferase HypF n=1 Tax=Butyrivibrio sp. WCD3002 TaxID=1280676 RepID=UPI0003F88028|nr:carbamoyltransferase HypF [Butyrivibrio sp. WCD3002]
MKALIRVTGAVQGVGYRPFVAELASKYALSGEVKNCGGIVEIIAEGPEDTVKSFAKELEVSYPFGSIVINVSLETMNECEPEGHKSFSGFRIVQSTRFDQEGSLPVFPPDIGICDDCLSEMLNSDDRRYRYPLISCVSCGPRYSILKNLPYDRENITMDIYDMCPECSAEYLKGRRRHAQTISCHSCGPQMIFKTTSIDFGFMNPKNGSSDHVKDIKISSKEDAVRDAIKILRDGGIIGLKGISGYQLVALPYNESVVQRLRDIKGREKKPFAIMFENIYSITDYCCVNEEEEKLLNQSSRPIVLLDKVPVKCFASNVCGISNQIGAFLPSSGIHVLLTKELGPLIVTSGNLSGHPMIVSDEEFEDSFADKIDGILYYKRDILRPLDDSVLQIVKTGDDYVNRFVRRSRGYVPLPIFLNRSLKEKVLYIAFGADLKNTFSIGYGDKIISSQYFGDMDELGIQKVAEKELKEMLTIFGTERLDISKTVVLCDMHPGYVSTTRAKDFYESLEGTKELLQLQHHHAHIGSVMAENDLKECIGIAFDGTGFGTDNTIWGSEILLCEDGKFQRMDHLRPVPIVGQDEAMKNAGILATCFMIDSGLDPEEVLGNQLAVSVTNANSNLAEDYTKAALLTADDLNLIKAALSNNINTYMNSGMGRLFDAVSFILGFGQYNSYEGECAIALQNAAEEYIKECDALGKEKTGEFLNLTCIENQWDTRELIKDITERAKVQDKRELSYAFHMTIAKAALDSCIKIRDKKGITNVCLSGGVFANRLLVTKLYELLTENGFMVYLNRFLPTNDGGISVGQIYLQDLRDLEEV